MEISWNLIGNTLERDIRSSTIPLYIKEGEGGILPLASQASHEPHSPLPFSTSYLQTNEGSV